MRKNDSEKIEGLRISCIRAGLWLDILSSGIGRVMERSDPRYHDDEIETLIGYVNGPLTDALTRYKAAEKAVEPFGYYRRYHRTRKGKKPAAKPKKTPTEA